MPDATEAQPISVIRGVHAVHPETGRIDEEVDLLVDFDRRSGGRTGRIVDIVPSRSGPGSDVIDGQGYFAIPGLIDAHVHALGFLYEETPSPFDLPWVLRQQRRNLAAYLRSGVTTVRDMCAPIGLIRRWARRAAAGGLQSPRILYAGPMLTVAGGYPHYLRPLPNPVRWMTGPLRVDLRDAEHAGLTVDWLARLGAQCIKVPVQSEGYDAARSPLPTMGPALFRAVVAAAHRRGLGVALHEVYLKDLRSVLDEPFDSLEHTPIDALLEEADVVALTRKRPTVTTTLSAYGAPDHAEDLARIVVDEPERFEAKPLRFMRDLARALARRTSLSDQFGDWMFDTGARFMRRNVRRLAEAGLPIVMGTDSGVTGLPGCPDWELEQLRRAGFSNLEALRAATVTAANAIGRPDLGRLAVGATADVVLLRDNPLEDVGAVRGVVAVVRDGRLMHRTSALGAGAGPHADAALWAG